MPHQNPDCSKVVPLLTYPLIPELDALFGPFILHILPASVHRAVVNAFTGILNVNPLRSGQQQ